MAMLFPRCSRVSSVASQCHRCRRAAAATAQHFTTTCTFDSHSLSSSFYLSDLPRSALTPSALQKRGYTTAAEPAAAAAAAEMNPQGAQGSQESAFTAEELAETRKELLLLGCSEEVAQSYLKLGEKVYCKMSPEALDTSAYLEQLPLALQILDGTKLHEYEESDRSRMTLAAQSVFRNAARDLNKDGHVSFKEFVLWAAMAGKAKRGDKRGRLHIAFRLMDQDGNGYVTMDELTAWVKIAINLRVLSGTEAAKLDPKEIAQAYMGKYDSNWDGKISLQEFLEMGVLMDLDMLFLQTVNRKKH